MGVESTSLREKEKRLSKINRYIKKYFKSLRKLKKLNHTEMCKHSFQHTGRYQRDVCSISACENKFFLSFHLRRALKVLFAHSSDDILNGMVIKRKTCFFATMRRENDSPILRLVLWDLDASKCTLSRNCHLYRRGRTANVEPSNSGRFVEFEPLLQSLRTIKQHGSFL